MLSTGGKASQKAVLGTSFCRARSKICLAETKRLFAHFLLCSFRNQSSFLSSISGRVNAFLVSLNLKQILNLLSHHCRRFSFTVAHRTPQCLATGRIFGQCICYKSSNNEDLHTSAREEHQGLHSFFQHNDYVKTSLLRELDKKNSNRKPQLN